MKRFLFFFLAFFFSLFFQAAVLHLPHPFLKVDLIFLLVFFIGLTVPLYGGAPLVLFIGLAAEVWLVPARGALAFSYLAVFLFLRMARDRIYLDGPLACAVWVFLLTALQKMLEVSLVSHRGPVFSPFYFIAVAMIQALVSIPVLLGLERGRRIWLED